MKDLQGARTLPTPFDWSGQPFITGLMASDSPCAIVDQAGVVTCANPAFAMLVPDSTGRPIQVTFFFRTPIYEEISAVRKLQVPNEVLYYDASGMLVPAWLHTLYEVPETGERLILLADGGPLRRAAEQRLDAAPLAVLRISTDGVVRFANAETYRGLSLQTEDVIGHTLESLFGRAAVDDTEKDKHCVEHLKSCFKDCLQTLKPVALDVSVAQYANNEIETAQMRLIPDLAPDGRALGVLAVIELTLEDRIRTQISKISRDASITWQERLGLVLQQVNRLIDFEHATFGMYADDVTLFRAFALYPSNDKFKWKERWLVLPEGMKAWAEGNATFIPDINIFLDSFPKFRKSEVVRMYTKQGIRSSATLVAKDDKGPTSALSVCSSEPSRFTKRDVEVLHNLNLEPVLIRIEEQILGQRMETANRLKKKLSEAKELSKAACEVVDELATTFQWDYVSLFRVDRHAAQFELYYESKCDKKFCIPHGYTQKLDDGMLGECLKREVTLVVNDVGNNEVEQYHYMGLARDIVRSAMTIPLRLNERIRWMLHIEAREAQAFHGPDRKSIDDVVALLEEGLKQRAILEVNRKIMMETRQGVVMVGLEGTILDVNEAASRLLGLKRDHKPERSALSDYASKDNPVSFEILSGFGSTERRRVELEGEDGRIRPVLATRRVLEGSFDTAIWFLIDLQTREWEVGMRYLRATVADVAQQTRGPLALACNIARELQQLNYSALSPSDASQPGEQCSAQALSKRLLAEIKKADITFERLAKSYEIRRYPMRQAESRPIDLVQSAKRVKDALPARDREFVQIKASQASFEVDGDVERLDFVIRSLVGHMLRVRSDEQRVLVSFTSGKGLVQMSFGLTHAISTHAHSDDNKSHDVMWRAFRIAREDACLGLNAVKRVVKAHCGSMETKATEWTNDDAAPPWIAFHITLPELTGDSRK
ncbi:PAS domain-containing protein [Cupriavidus sp. RAF12]|uniref:PAS domain-containing protein n=1 Tax=Cupriavidus sp. RAF12 TaxID=3233050 RepID=UPI003F91453E